MPTPILYKTAHLKAPSEDAEDRSAPFVFSTADIDRDGEILEQDWNLSNFLKNPIVLWSHDKRSKPIGRADSTGVVDGKLQGVVIFASKEANPEAESIFRLYKEGMINTVSVGFIPGDYRWEQRDGKEVLIFSKNELVEVSLTPVPSNVNATRKELTDYIDRQKSFAANQSCGRKETEMADKENKSPEIATLDKTITEQDTKIKALEAERDVLKSRCDTSEAQLADAMKKLGELTTAAVEKDIDALIGKKITAAEKPSLMKLALVDKGLFDEQLTAIKGRPDLTIAKDIIPDVKPGDVTKTISEDGSELADLANTVAFRS